MEHLDPLSRRTGQGYGVSGISKSQVSLSDILIGQNDAWAIQRARYITLESMVGLRTVAAGSIQAEESHIDQPSATPPIGARSAIFVDES